MQTFLIWKSHFKSKLKSGDWNLQTAEIWSIALADMGWSEVAHTAAERKSLQLEWPPSSAKEFHKLAIFVLFDDVYKAHRQAIQGVFKSGVAYETTKRLGGHYELVRMDEKTSFSRWQSVYAQVCGEMLKGAVFTQPISRQIEQKQETQNIISAEMQNKINRFLTTFGKKKHGQQGVKV